ncbi:MAG: hydrogenase maturation protein HypF, partial [Actinomycetota bacterium]|nr:hydrogenase maturation protein HypF [Actinomycetota bacterium]
MTPSALSELDGRIRRLIRVRGVVQGVGFRPFVFRLATGLGLAGLVGNDAEGVFVEVEGDSEAIADFERRLVRDPPVLARIDTVVVGPVDVLGEQTFRIVESRAGAAVQTFVPPDIAVCDDCRREMFDPLDRRYRYPFINCTNCGPRFTITVRLPYDRPNTTMAAFSLCAPCAAEYDDPADRRFHAQPVACATCGPRLWFEDTDGVVEGTDAAVAAAQRALGRGAVVAVKGLGGYHLACDARSPNAVARLRRRKSRPDKPLAVMVPDLAAAMRLGSIDEHEAARLTSPQRPIVLVPRRDIGGLAESVAPGSPFVGVMLAYTPLHHLLFGPVPDTDSAAPDVLVMTSGNISDEPICYDDADARQRLRTIADAWLIHDRPIHVPCDDSVVRVVDGDDLPIRRSRGYAPLTIRLPFAAPPTLAVGAELKNTFCLASGTNAWMSQHIGDMGSVETLTAFERSTGQFAEMYGVHDATLIADAHPGYHTRAWAEARTAEPVVVAQHHHAHIASVMAEHGLPSRAEVIGFAFDGTGYGTDGAIWGGEVLVAGYAGFERASHLRYVPLPGGDTTVRKPYRAALAHLWAAGIDWTPDLAPAR